MISHLVELTENQA